MLIRMAEAGRGARPWSRVIVMAVYEDRRRDGTISGWHALWEGDADPTQPLGEFDGSREDAITWAHACSPSEILVFNPETKDLQPVE